MVQQQRATAVDVANAAAGGASGETGLLRGLIAQASLILVLGGVYVQSLLPGAGHSHDTAEAQFSVPLLCVTHPTGYPTYLLLGHAFSRLVPFGTPAYRANLLSAVFGILTCLVVRRLLRRLGARELVAWAIAVAFGLTPTFWRYSVVAEVYSLNLLFVALISDWLLKWRHTLRDRDLLVACAFYVASFGNHLTMITLLPAFVLFVVATRRRVLVEWKLVCAVGGLILLGLVPYAYPVVRSLDLDTPYLAHSVTNLAELWGYATGSAFRGEMFAFTTSQLLYERVPMFTRFFWHECAPLIPLAVVGLVALADCVTVVYLGLVFLGHVVFSLGYAIGDVDNYFIPTYFATAVLAGVGLERVLSSRVGQRVPAVLCLSLPLALGAYHRPEVQRLKGPEQAEPMRALLEDSRDGALIIARYNDYMYLLYFTLAERPRGPSVFVGCEIEVADIVAYVRDDRPLYLVPLRKWAPPGLPVYSTRLNLRPELRAAGLGVKTVKPGVFQIERQPVTATVATTPSSAIPASARD
jgi:hypothetical protein